MRDTIAAYWSEVTPGDPRATAQAVLDVVDADQPPLRIFLGAGPLEVIREEYAQRIAVWEEWNDVSEAAMGSPVNQVG